MGIGAVELDLASGYGGDLSRTPDGDLLLAVDTPTYPAASIQRLARIIQTNPVVLGSDGTPVGRPDDLFNPTFGSGARASIGEPSLAVTDTLQSHILAAIAADSSFAASPAPLVVVTDLGGGFVAVDVSVTTIAGQLVTLPSMTLAVYGS